MCTREVATRFSNARDFPLTIQVAKTLNPHIWGQKVARTQPVGVYRLAERVGFEPTEPCGSRALQARALDRTMRPLQ